MILKHQQLKVVMPPDIHDIFHMHITDHNGLIFAMMRVNVDVMAKLQEKDVEGRPVAFSFDGKVITVYPRPDKDYPDVTVEYFDEEIGMNYPREGNRPGIPIGERRDPPENNRHSLIRKMESGLAEPTRDTLRNRVLAENNGWSDAEYWHWVDTGDPPTHSMVKETTGTRPNEIDDDERLHE